MPEDEPLLKSLTNISLSMSDTTDDYSLTFHFSQNDYITNERLTLKVEVDKDDDTKKITSDDISWKDDKCLTEKTVTKTQTNKKTKKKREIQKKQKQESFFHIFKTRNVEDDDEEEEELEDEDAMGMFYDAGSIGDALSVYKYMISKYHGASYFGAEIPDYKFDDGYGAEDSDEEDDQDDEDEDRDDAPKKSKKPKAVAPAKGPGQEECKKQ